MSSRKDRSAHTNRIQSRRRQSNTRPRPLVIIESRLHLDFTHTGSVRFGDGQLKLVLQTVAVEFADNMVVVKLVDGAAAIGKARVFT